MKHLYIAVEGIDGAGSTTLSLALAKALKAIRIVEPANDAIGHLLRAHLSGALHFPYPHADEIRAHLFVASRLAIQGGIKLNLKRSHVASDRCSLSTYVYQPGVPWLDVAHEHILAPDWIILVNTPPEVAYQRLHSRPHREVFDELDSLKEHHRRYIAYASDPPAPLLGSRWMVIDGQIPTDQAVRGIVDEVCGAEE